MVGFQRLFIANRGEVAVRIARACDELGITPVFGVSTADRDAPYTRGRVTVCLGPARGLDPPAVGAVGKPHMERRVKTTRCGSEPPTQQVGQLVLGGVSRVSNVADLLLEAKPPNRAVGETNHYVPRGEVRACGS